MKRPYLFYIFIALVLLLSIARPAVAESNIALSEVLDNNGRISNLGNRSGAVDFTGFYPVIDDCEGLVFLNAPPAPGWNALGSGVINGTVEAIAISGSNVYVGGSFSGAIRRWDGSSWHALGSGINNGSVLAIAISGSDVYVGGSFTNAGGNSDADRIARWSETYNSWNALLSGLTGSVRAIAISGTNVYVGGNFNDAGGNTSADRIALWDGSSWHALGSGLPNLPNHSPRTIVISGNDVYIGGQFTSVGGNSNAVNIARWDGSSWHALSSGLNNWVEEIAISGSDVYAVGGFTDAGGNTNADYIARWNGSSWNALGTGLPAVARTIAISGSNVYVGGDFENAGGDPDADRIARWDGSSWNALGTGIQGDVSDYVLAIAISGSDVYVGGFFEDAGSNINADYIARWEELAPPSTLPFITTWNTNITYPGSSANNQITIPGTGTNYTIAWEQVDNPSVNGTATGNNTTTATFPAPGTYRVSISGDFTRIEFNNGGDKEKLLTIEQWGDIAWSSMANAFYGCANLTSSAADAPDLSSVTDCSYMFSECTVFNGPIGNWNTGSVTNMSLMFSGAAAFNQPIGSWNTANVTDMSGMFSFASAFDQPIGSWSTTNVTNMNSMFSYAGAFDQPIGSWNTANVTDMGSMFKDAVAFNQPIGGWNTGNVTNMNNLFENAPAFNQPIDGWNTGSVASMESMFRNAASFDQPIGSWNTANVTNMGFMFQDAVIFNRSLNTWNTGSVTNMASMFYNAYAFDGAVGAWNTANVGDMSYMFNNAVAFNQPIGNWNTASVEYMSFMFSNATSFNQDISTWNTASVTSMGSMFSGASGFNQPVSDWNIANVTDMSYLFSGATAFNQSLSNWTFNSSVSLVGMLSFCGMDCDNYSATLLGWNNNPNTPDGLNFGANGLQYGTNAQAARDNLVNAKSWAIAGDSPSGMACPQVFRPFITTWNTNITYPGSSANNQITIPGTGTDYTIAWEQVGNPAVNGTATGNNTTTVTFPAPGTYRVSISGDFTRIEFNNGGDKEKLLTIEQWGEIAWSSMANAFRGCTNLTSNAADAPNLSAVTDMSRMFALCSSFNGPVGSWNTSNVTNMSAMFEVTDVFNQPISSWNTSSVTDMSIMFAGAAAFNQPIGSWNTANVTDMSGMFFDAGSFNQPIGSWNTNNVTNMNSLFAYAGAFNQPIGSWNTASVTDMGSMFKEAAAFNQPIGNWNTANVTSMAYMFEGAASFDQPIGSWATGSVTFMRSMFSGASSFNQPVSSWNIANVADMYGMFSNAGAFNQPLGDWTFNSDVDLGEMLFNCGMSLENYDNTLIAWNNNPLTPSGREIGASFVKYCIGIDARTDLEGLKGWTFNGDEHDCSGFTIGSTLDGNWASADTWSNDWVPNSTNEVIIQGGSTITLNGAATANGLTIGTASTLSLEGNATLTLSAPATNNGTLQGIGTIEGSIFTNTSDGTIVPGASPGCLSFTDGLTNDGAVIIEVNGTTACSGYDRINVTGTANLGGALAVSINGNYTPANGDVITFIDATSISGAFTTVNPPLPVGWSLAYNTPSAGKVSLQYFSAPLPVELITFEVRRQNDNAAHLSWRTATENNNKGFHIERSADGRSWQTLGFVPGHGTTQVEQAYSFTDKYLLPGLNYYRLKQVDFDGSFEYSGIQSILIQSDNNPMLVSYPNPASGQVNIHLAGLEGEASLEIYDQLGRLVWAKPLSYTGQDIQIDLNDESFRNGNYLVSVIVKGERLTHRMVIVK